MALGVSPLGTLPLGAEAPAAAPAAATGKFLKVDPRFFEPALLTPGKKPVGDVVIDADHGLAPTYAGVLLGKHCVVLPRNKLSVTEGSNATIVQNTTHFIANADTSAALSNRIIFENVFQTTDHDFTITGVFKFEESTVGQIVEHILTVGGNTGQQRATLGIGKNNGERAVIFNNGNILNNGSNGVLALEVPYFIALTHDSSTDEYVANYIRLDTFNHYTFSQTFTWPATVSPNLVMGSYARSGTAFYDSFEGLGHSWGYYKNRILSDSQLLELARNPYQFLKPTKPGYIWIPDAAAASGGYWLPDPRWEMPELLVPGEKPIGDVVIDTDHPLAKTCVGFMAFNEFGSSRFSDLNGGTGSFGATPPTWEVSEGLRFDAAAESANVTQPLYDFTSEDFTIVVKFRGLTTGWFNYPEILSRYTYNASGWRLYYDAYQARLGFETYQSGTSQKSTVRGVQASSGTTIAIVRTGAVVKFYQNGVELTDNYVGGTHIDPVTKSGDLVFSNTGTIDTIFSTLGFFTSALTQGQLLSLADDPYQFLIPA